MHWLVIATAAYFLIALQSILDKFLLSSRRVGHPVTYAFYSGLLSLSSFLLFPFGFHSVSAVLAAAQVAAGVVFTYGILFLFWAIRDHEASQTVPVVGAVTAAVTYLFSWMVLGEKLAPAELWGIVILVSGGLIISFDFSPKALRRIFTGFEFSLISGILLALSYTLFKKFYLADNFVNVYIWTRFGLLIGALTFLAVPAWRKAILKSLFRFHRPKRNDRHSGALFIFNKGLGGVGSFLLNYSISLGSVTVINALISLEYVFIFILAWFMNFWVKDVFKEKRDASTLIQKLFAIVIIAVGMIMVTGR